MINKKVNFFGRKRLQINDILKGWIFFPYHFQLKDSLS